MARAASAVMAILVVLGGCDRTPEPSPSTREAPKASASSPAPVVASAAPESSSQQRLPQNRRFVEDMNTFCVITQEVKSDEKIPGKDKASTIVKRLLAAKTSPEFLLFVRDLAELPPKEQYKSLKRAAADRGAPNWQCPALDE